MNYAFTAPSRGDAVAILAFGVVGVVCCSPVIVLSTWYAELRQPPGRFVRLRSLFTVLQTAACMVYAAWILAYEPVRRCRSGVDERHADVADSLLVAVGALETGIALWQLAQVLELLTIVRDPFKPRRHTRKLGLAVCVVTAAEPVLIAIALLTTPAPPASGTAPAGCLSPRMASLLGSARLWLSAFDVLVIASAVGFSAMMIARLRSGLAISSPSRRRVSVQLLAYVLGAPRAAGIEPRTTRPRDAPA